MKRNKIILGIVAVLLISVAACKKITTDKVSETDVVSAPVIKLNGPQYVSIAVGGTYTDQGATASDTMYTVVGGVTFDASGVDASTPGLYPVVYKVKNNKGFETITTRFVAVTNVLATENVGGLYRRTGTSGPMNVSLVTRGIYKTDNVGGVAMAGTNPVTANPSFLFDTYFVQINDSTLLVPAQPWIAGELYCTSSKLRKLPTDTTIEWVVRNSSFGTALRVFSHQ
ncbi:MAG: DUF5011 domain-containing protein [Bacteroidetes bacterium]|nr:DUF5011 domain-containing protein [Bacteroidota bacterium]